MGDGMSDWVNRTEDNYREIRYIDPIKELTKINKKLRSENKRLEKELAKLKDKISKFLSL